MRKLLLTVIAAAALALPATATAQEYALPAGMWQALEKPPSYPTGGVGRWFAGAYSDQPSMAWVQITAVSTSLENEAERVCIRYVIICAMADGLPYNVGYLNLAWKEVGGTINVPNDRDEVWVKENDPLRRQIEEKAFAMNVSAAKLLNLREPAAPLIVVHVEKTAAALIRKGHRG